MATPTRATDVLRNAWSNRRAPAGPAGKAVRQARQASEATRAKPVRPASEAARAKRPAAKLAKAMLAKATVALLDKGPQARPDKAAPQAQAAPVRRDLPATVVPVRAPPPSAPMSPTMAVVVAASVRSPLRIRS